MKNLMFIFCILIILFKTGNVLSDNNIFNVNNVEINKKNYENTEKLVDKAFLKAFDELINRLLLKEDYNQISKTNLEQIKKLISYYQIINQGKKDKNSEVVRFNIFFDKNRIQNFFYNKNILYSDIINTEVIIFPLLKKNEEFFIFSKNYFYKSWNDESLDKLIQYNLLPENIEIIQRIGSNKSNIYKLDIADFFKEYETESVVFANIDMKKDSAEIFLKTRIEGKKINKNLSIKKIKSWGEEEYYKKIILDVNNLIRDLIKSQNLIDVRTPSFLNVKIKMSNKSNLILFNNRLKKIDLIDNFYVQELNKDHVLVKIKYLGKISKIIKKLKDQNIDLKMIAGQWQLNII